MAQASYPLKKAPFITFALATLFVILSTMATLAEPRVMTAPDAFAAASQRDILILDIRRPSEWAASGVAKGALPVTMHNEDFGANLRAILSQHPDTPIALICATGVRSKYLASVLDQNGIRNVIDISEGMFGNAAAPGWIARGLPIVDAQTAVSDAAQARSE